MNFNQIQERVFPNPTAGSDRSRMSTGTMGYLRYCRLKKGHDNVTISDERILKKKQGRLRMEHAFRNFETSPSLTAVWAF
jgi:hypothetical protein